MNYWVYKCNTRGEAVGNNQWGDWEEKYAFGGDGRTFDWGNVSEIPDLARPKKGDRVIAHQTDRHRLVGVAEVMGLRDGEFRLKPLERIGADMRELKKQHATVARIPAYQGGPIRSIYDISSTDAERLLRIARNAVATGVRGAGSKSRRRLADMLDEIAALEGESDARDGGQALTGAGQGFGLTPKERRAIERRAVEVAAGHFESGGWEVEDVGDRESFDLCCRRKGVELHVEVKGTTGLGQIVILSKNEVRHAQAYKHVALVIVHGVTLKKGQSPTATGGKMLVRHPWKLSESDLEPLAYYYEVK